jgi:hypothetical protein
MGAELQYWPVNVVLMIAAGRGGRRKEGAG